MNIRRSGLMALALAGSLVVGACGSDSNPGPAATNAPDTAAASDPTAASATDATSTDATAAPETTPTTPTTENSGPVELSLVAFSVPKAANEEIEKAFAATPQGAGTTWV